MKLKEFMIIFYDIPQTLRCQKCFSRHKKHFLFIPKNWDIVVVDCKNLSSRSSFKNQLKLATGKFP